MDFNSCFDIIGPVMVGPSSSHTAGVVSIGNFVHNLLGHYPEEASITFFDSFAATYHGHGTDKAIIGGLIGMKTDNLQIKNALLIAKQAGLNYQLYLENHCEVYNHPNTTIITATYQGETIKVGGVSLGGGVSKIFMINEEKVNVPLSISMINRKEEPIDD
ncbi:serine dehydratase beta chain [Gracilibacillus sp. S3-1-1]|uniref:Serine dehydratase beta chain n=1 Tax=Gracilibacillus pellucidus TaxID=3095368 RepID=A0ACC6M032_9BACI|nr:serine dehydratase beta chain [Gracilibacillus sp. S3-1-1]MDX8044360.1 serine dehydratase beta chain [Gracilibacillus sp. S3-1-1]